MPVSLQELTQCLSQTLSNDTATRIKAELHLGDLLAAPETGLALAQLVAQQNANVGLRQSAAIILRRFVNERWSPALPKWKGTSAPVELKAQTRQIVFQCLSDPQSKIRSLCAQILTTIASADWPDEWPDLLDALIALLSSNSPASVHGSMQVLAEFIKSDLTEDQILPILRQLLPILLNILGAPQQHSVLTRARAVSVFKTCVETLFMVKQEHPQAVKEAAASILPAWLEAFKYLLNIDPRQDVEGTPNWDGIALRIQIYKALDTIHVPFSKQLLPYINDLLTVSLNHLTLLYPTFVHYYLMGEEPVPLPSENEATELTQLFCAIMDLVSVMTRMGRSKKWFDGGNARALVIAMFNWIQITKEDEEEWANNANAFVANEAEEALSFSVRVSGLDMLAALIEEFQPVAMRTIQQAIQEITRTSNEARDAGNPDWWRPLEAMLAAVGSQAEDVLEWIEDQESAGHPSPMDIEPLLTNVVPNLLGLADCPFLQGRAFVFASQYTKVLPTQLAGQYLEATVHVLEASDAGVPIKISALRAVQNFCKEIDDALLEPVAPRIVKAIGPFLSVTTEDTLSLVLEALDVVVKIGDGKWMTTDLASSLVDAILDIWMKNNRDPIFISLLTEILASLALSPAPAVYATVVKKALPPLCNAIMASTAREPWIAGTAIDLVSSLIQGAPASGLGDGFINILAPSLFLALRTVEDRDVIQNGTACITLIIRKDYPQLKAWTDPTSGQSGLECVLAVLAQQLKSNDESGGLVVGDLIIHLFRRAGESVLPVLPDLLKAMLARMTQAKTASFIQSLVIPFAFLIYNQRDTMLAMLESMDIQGRSGLDILLQTWCENEETFQGFWAQRISTLALCSLYISERPSLQKITVKGDLIIKPETRNVIMTRSRTKQMPTEFTRIPFPVKALKLLLRDLQTGGESATRRINLEDVESDDGESEWLEESMTTVKEKFPDLKDEELMYLSDVLSAPTGLPFDNDDTLEASDDDDLKNDPVSQMDMRGHLLTFFRECAAHNTNNFSAAIDQLTPEEVMVVGQVVGH
ncbi:ARM repeat-containing protein [Laetiporus sulphureus 93-53]|uniref:ARM repeat-containing protein n=1 Tax=Laetiporus sulphureus 93-53 TaxID=1314785 RepID=A0A165C593_9APHY|nr:ARM repeat-containing protein [Laetiporus sulphureus 93-53]KZT02228.1 ARM repeat-containing protein [Laetiporus sulphureus 93-53]